MFIAISVSGSAPAPGSLIGNENSVPNSLSVKNKYPGIPCKEPKGRYRHH